MDTHDPNIVTSWLISLVLLKLPIHVIVMYKKIYV